MRRTAGPKRLHDATGLDARGARRARLDVAPRRRTAFERLRPARASEARRYSLFQHSQSPGPVLTGPVLTGRWANFAKFGGQLC